MVDLCVMQCMPLGPPRVGKTCLKRRLLDEGIPNSVSPSTPIVGEKQTVLVESPDTNVFEARGTNSWKHIPWENEVFYVIEKFKNSPQSLYHSLRSLDSRKSWIALLFIIAFPLCMFTLFAQQWLLALFFSLSSMNAIVELFWATFVYSQLTYSAIFYMLQLLTYIASVLTYKKVASLHPLLLALKPCFEMLQYYCDITLISFLLFASNTMFYMTQMYYCVLGCDVNADQIDWIFFAALHLLVFQNNHTVIFFQSLLPRMGHEILVVGLHLFGTFQLIYYYNTFIQIVFWSEVFKIITVLLAVYKHSPSLLLHWLCIGLIIYSMVINQIWVMILIDIVTLSVFFIIFISRLHNKRIVNPDDHGYTSNIVQTAANHMPNIPLNETSGDSSSLKIYFTDAGGQPEFQEVLPALLSGPTVFFIVFNLAQGFNANYKVEYVDSKCSDFSPYETQFTVMDALLQCLASISCLGEFSKTPSRANIGIKPKVFFVGTHKDLVSKSVIANLEKELRDAVKNTAWYKKDMIQFASSENLIFSVNNFDKSDISFGKVRQAIQNLSQTDGYKFKIRAPWLGLELTLRAHADNVISFSECEKIAKKCSINSKEDLNNALWFLHNRIGSVRHYQQIDKLNDVVITKPQVLSTVVTDLLVSTFPFASGKLNTKFREKGRFTREELQKIGKINKTGLSVTQVIALLCYLHILAPLKMDRKGNRDYFLPCALSHAPKPDRNQLQLKGQVFSPVLLIGFKCGYTPKGVFSALVSYMLQHTDSCGNEWSLDEDCIFRDQTTFLIGTTGCSLTITYLPKFLELEFRNPETESKNLPKEVHLNILTSLSKGLNIVRQRLNYTCETDPLFGFYCNYTSCRDDERHPAFKRNDDILACDKHASRTFEMNDDQKKCFRRSGYLNKVQAVVQKVCRSLFSNMKKCIFLFIVVLIVVLILIPFCFKSINFDIHEPVSNEHSDVRNIQMEYYSSLCDHNSAHGNLSCILFKQFQLANRKPIRLFLSTKEHELYDKISNCALTVSFDDCYPEDCSNPMSEVRNAFLKFLQSCPLSNNVTWPVIHHLVGFTTVNQMKTFFVSIFKQTIGIDISLLTDNIAYYYYHFHYNILSHNCTKNLINAIEKKKLTSFRELLIIMKFTLYTQPNLTPIIFLKSIEHAINGTMPIQEILTDISEEVSSINWLIPIIATSNDKSWIRKTGKKQTQKKKRKIVNQLFYRVFPVYKQLNSSILL